MAFKHLIFDLDGTLIDTIEDIRAAINEALRLQGYGYSYDREGTKSLIGDGADMLLHRALREKGGDLQAFSALKPVYMELYRQHNLDLAIPFQGLVDVLSRLKEQGVDFCCVTNKPEPLAKALLESRYGKDFFACIIGASDEYPVKPHPASTLACIQKMGYALEECLYVGDSHVDIETGHNAGLPVALCTWGYEVDYAPILERAEYVLKEPSDLEKVFGARGRFYFTK